MIEWYFPILRLVGLDYMEDYMGLKVGPWLWANPHCPPMPIMAFW